MTESYVSEECRVALDLPTDNVGAIGAAKRMAAQAGFGETEQHLIATAVSELATNILRYAGSGEVVLRLIHEPSRMGMEVLALDHGPGIADIDAAMRDSFSTGNSLGLGLPGVRRIMDEFSIDSKPGEGTRCLARKWRRR